MSPGRTLLALAALAAGLAIGVPLLSNSLHKLGAQGWSHANATKGGLIQPATPTPHTTPVTGLLQPPTPAPAPGSPHPDANGRRSSAHAQHSPSRGQSPRDPAPRPGSHARPPTRHRAQPGGLLPAATLHALIKAGLEIAIGVGLIALLLVVLVLRRIGPRSRREYALYELHLSAHDQAKPQDLEDMVESIANIVRAFPADRIRDGQPYVALELVCNEGHGGMEWSVNVRCEPRVVVALDAAISATYPDVRVGRRHADAPRPRAGALREPGHVMRFRKQRSFVYPLVAAGEQLASPPVEQIARAQIALGEPSIVRFQLTPTALFFERYARRRYKHHEQHLSRHEPGGPMLTGLRSTLDRTEMGNAQRTQNRSLFWLETVIAADSLPACKTLAAAVQSRRGENRLHRRWMIARQRLYRRRFPKASRPLIPSTRCLVSAAEVAHLLELPTARMKGVPVRRLMLPRIPAPPELERITATSESRGLWPMLRAENAQVAIRAIDRKYGVLAAGGQGAGKTATLLALYRSDLADRNAAPIVADPKSEIAPLCLAHTPPDCSKQVWYLDLGHPAFGMNPLLRAGERALALEAAEIAENVVAALLDVNEDQIFASSRRYLAHAVIGALALAETEHRRPTFEDMHSLLEPANQDLRNRAGQACADIPNLDISAHFLRVELPNELRLATSQTTVRMDAPRNKISTLLQAAPIRRFLHHPTNVSIRQIIQARDILIIDCAQGQVGDDNVKPMLLFMLRMLHRQMQRQVTLPEDQRPRVPVIIDEAHYVADTENFVDQIATHRRAGLEMACGIQYFAQLGSGSRHAEKIRKGILNLLQSRLLFRMGDADDAQQATRIAMAVYATMIRDDPDSRARMRVTPEQLLNFPNHHCLASWIANGTRAPSFTGQTYPLPDPNPDWAEHHLTRQAQRVGPYPEHHKPATLDTHSATANPPGNGSQPAHRDPEARTSTTSTPNGTQLTPADADHDGQDAPARGEDTRGQEARKREVRVDYEPPPPLPNLADSPVRRIVGRRVPGPPPGEHDTPAPASLRELAYLDRINEIGPADELDGAAKLPRLYDADYAILALLDRAGLVPRTMIGRSALPGRGANAVSDRLTKLYRHGLIAQHPVGIREHTRSDGKPPLLYSITRRGLEVAQTREPPAISQRRQWRAIEPGRGLRLAHDLHALAWAIELHRLVGNLATDHWRTPRYATGRIPVPQTGSSRARHPITVNEIALPDKQAIIDVALNPFTEVQPDISLELRIPSIKLTFDLLVELDLTSRPSYNHDKLLGYDAFLCGWSLAHPRYQTHTTRPVAVFVSPDPHAALALAQEADEALTGRIGVMGTGPEHWYHPARDHTFFAVETDIHHGNLSALALPALPPGLRHRLTGTRDLELKRVALLPDTLTTNKRNK